MSHARAFGTRLSLVGATVVSLVAVPVWGQTAQTTPRAERRSEREREADAVTTDTFEEPEPGIYPHWELLRLPEITFRLALTPLLPLVALAQENRLDKRIEDLVTNEDKTSLLLPVIVFASRDGFGAGASYSHKNLFGDGEKFAIKGVIKTNADRDASLAYSEKIAALDGRALGGEAEYELDQNERYYGIGNDTDTDDERLLEFESWAAEVEFELGGPDTDLASFGSNIAVGYLRESLAAGNSSGTELPVGEPGDTVAPPPGFDETTDYVNVRWTFSHDLRDSTGRIRKGTLLSLDLDAISDVNGAGRNALLTTARGAVFVPVAPRYRVLVFSGGAAGATPWTEAGTVPLAGQVVLGRTNYLRGYAKRRFRDVLGYWGNVEYRYPIFDFRDTGVGLSSTLFFDVGRVAGAADELIEGPLRYSYGAGVRGEASTGFIFRAQVGLSPEGVEATFSLNDTP